MSAPRKNFILCFIIIFLLSPVLFADQASSFVFDSVRARAMGGMHVALADDISAIFSNPAGFASIEGEFSVAELGIGLYGPLFDLGDAFLESLDSGGLPEIPDLIGPKGLFVGALLNGPIALAWVGDHLGFGLFSRASGDLALSGSSLRTQLSADILAAGGYGHRFALSEKQSLEAGFLFKGFMRYYFSKETFFLSASEILDFNFFENYPLDVIFGIGLDLGLRYSVGPFALAITCDDVYSPAIDLTYKSFNSFAEGQNYISQTYFILSPLLNVGIMFSFDGPRIKKYISSLVFLLDYKDILDLFAAIPRHPILNASFGVELTVLDALSFRAGIQDALLSLGVGMDLTVMRIDVAMRGVELGIDPGKNTEMALDLALLFRY